LSVPVNRFFTHSRIAGQNLLHRDIGRIELGASHSRPAMPNRHAPVSALDHSHCRAICDEIGERLRLALKPNAAQIPPRLQALMERLAQLDDAPSIVPDIDDMIAPQLDATLVSVRPSSGRVRPATSRGSVFAGS
jgi:hypothetical protein